MTIKKQSGDKTDQWQDESLSQLEILLSFHLTNPENKFYLEFANQNFSIKLELL